MAHRQHKKPKLDAAKESESGLADTNVSVLETSDMDLITDNNPPNPDPASLGGEQDP
jgi:hypothetical protein